MMRSSAAKYQELKDCVDEMVDLLRQAGLDFWVRWFAKSQTLLEAEYPNSLGHVVSAYGGAGSFNDVPLDEPLESQKDRCYALARELLDEAHRGDVY
jgi:hypothetical protein